MDTEHLEHRRAEYLLSKHFSEVTANLFDKAVSKNLGVSTVRNWLAGKKSTIRASAAAVAAADFFANQRFPTHKAKREAMSVAIEHFIRYGFPTPFAIFSGHAEAIGAQLTFEHETNFVDPAVAACIGLADLVRADELTRSQIGKAAAFLGGAPPTDWGVVDKVAICRPEEETLVDALAASQLVVFTGAAGDGKTTILKRLALRLRRSGHDVFYAETPPVGRAFPVPPPFDSPAYILIDRADMADSYDGLTEGLADNPNLRVVLCARDYEWKKKGLRLHAARAITVRVGTIDEAQARALATRVLAYNACQGAPDQDAVVARILTSVRNKKHPHLLAAMMSATRGKNFEFIVDDLIAAFERGGDDWILRYVACGAVAHELSRGNIELLPHYLLERLTAERLDVTFSSSWKDRVRAALARFEAEIIPIRLEPFARFTMYDLRHPDIVWRVIEKCYRCVRGDVLLDPTRLLEDLQDIVKADRMAAIDQTARKSLEQRYAARMGLAWLTASKSYEWLTKGIREELMDAVIDSFGTWIAERNSKAILLGAWASWELQRAPDERRTDRIDALFERAVAETSDASLWVKWADSKSATKAVGQWPNPEPMTARAIYLRAWKENKRTPHLAASWATLEWRAGNIGTREGPSPYSARWLFVQALPEGLSNAQFVAQWSRLEHEWEYPQAGEGIDWRGNPSSEELYGSYWILRAAWKCGLSRVFLATHWASLEIRSGNVGDVSAPQPFSARWLLRYGASWPGEGEPNRVNGAFESSWLKDANYVQISVSLENALGHFGRWPTEMDDTENPAPFSVRWVFREALAAGLTSPSPLPTWVRLEEESGNIGEPANPARYSARWICQEAHRLFRRDLDLKFFDFWIAFEIRNANLNGDRATFHARRLLELRANLGQDQGRTLLWEAQILQVEGKIGTFDSPDENTARATFRALYAMSGLIARAWGRLERGAEDTRHGVEFSLEWMQERLKENGNRLTSEQWLANESLDANDTNRWEISADDD